MHIKSIKVPKLIPVKIGIKLEDPPLPDSVRRVSSHLQSVVLSYLEIKNAAPCENGWLNIFYMDHAMY